MLKSRLLIAVIACLCVFGSVNVWGQGTENFSGLTTGISGYATRTWTGTNSESWQATDARTDQTISTAAITIRNGALTFGLTTAQKSAGIGNLTLSAKAPFGTDNGSLQLVVNGTTISSNSVSGTSASTKTWSNINVASLTSIVINQTVSGARITIDNISWTAAPSVTSTINQLTTGLAPSPLSSGTTNKAVFGFSASSDGTPNLTAFNVGTSTTSVSKFGNIKLYRSTDDSYATAGDNAEITGITVSQTGTRIRISGFTEALSSTAKNFFVAIDVDGAVTGATAAVQPSLANDSVTVSAGTVTGGTLTGTSFAFAASGSPTLTAGALSGGFGNVCINTEASANPSFTITGSDLTTTAVSVSGNAAYTFATTAGGTYSNPLSLGNVSCSGSSCYSQAIYVKFTPTSVTSYDGNITVAGGGATSVTTAVTGSGVTVPSISSSPGDQTVNTNNPATFTVTASNATSYSWFEDPNTGTFGSALATGGVYNVSGNTLTVTPTSTTYNNYKYRVSVTNACGSTTSTPPTGAVLTVNSAPSVILAWQLNGNAGDEVTVNATTVNSNLNPSTLARSNVFASALPNGYNSNNYPTGGGNTRAAAIATPRGQIFTISAKSSYKVSLSTLDVRFRRSASGPNAFVWQYSLDSTNFTDIGSDISYTGTLTGGEAQAQINLSGITDLQNVAAGNKIYIRLIGWGATNTGGTLAIGRSLTSDATDYSLAIGGYVQPLVCTGTPGNPTAITVTPASPAALCAGYSSSGITLGLAGTVPTNSLYQWQSATSSGGSYSDILNATSATYVIPTGLTGSGNWYRCVVTCGGTSVNSDERQIVVNAIPSAPGVPSGATSVCNSSRGNVYTVTSALNTTYNWSVSGTGWSIPVPSTTNSVTVTAGTANGTVSVTATKDGCTSAASQLTGITIKALPTFNPTIPMACVGGGDSTFTVQTATGGSFAPGFGGAPGTTVDLNGSDPNYFLNPGGTNGERYFIYTAANGCSDTLVVRVGNTPTLNINTDPICDGGTALTTKTLTGTGGNGWSIVSGGGGFTSILGGTAIYTPLSSGPGSKTVRYAQTYANCYQEVTFTVNPLPVFTPTAASLCVNGANGAVTVSTATGGSFTAVSGLATGVSINGTDPTYSIAPGGVTGTRTFNYVASTGCGKDFVVTVNNLPASPTFTTATTTRNVTTTCSNATGLTYQATGGTSYNWTFPSGWTFTGGTGATATVTAIGSSGTISVTNTSGGCTSTAATLSVTVNAAPAQPSVISGPTTACANATGLQYSVDNTPGVTYAWSIAGSGWSITSPASTSAITVTAGGFNNGNVTVTPTQNGCAGTARSLTGITVNSAYVPSVSISNGASAVCIGSSNTFTATRTDGNGGTASYEWFVNGVSVSTANPYVAAANSLDNEDAIHCVMTVAGSCAVPATATSNVLRAQKLAYNKADLWPGGKETFGTGTAYSTPNITGYTGYTNGQTGPITWTMSLSNFYPDIRNSNPSSNYNNGGSNPNPAGSNLFFASTGTAGGVYSCTMNGINTTNAFPNVLSFWMFNNGVSVSYSNFGIDYSVDGTNYFPVIYTATGSSTGWYYVSVSNAFPMSSNLKLRFTQKSGIQIRIDDVKIEKYTTADAAIDTSGPATFCAGNNVTLTANPASGTTLTYSWTGGNTTNNITVSATGTSSVTITDAFGCKSSASKATTASANVIYYRDVDGDGYGNVSVTQTSCTGAPTGYVTDKTDCNDNNAAVHPGATEICGNGIDEDCAGGDLVCSGGAFVWNGSKSTDWNNKDNWTPSTIVPNGCLFNVTIPKQSPSVPNQPEIANAAYSVGNITLDNDAFVLLSNANGSLNVCGNIKGGTGNGSAFTGVGKVILKDATVQHQIEGKVFADIIRLDDGKGAGFVANGTLNVQGRIELKAGTFTTTGGTLRFKSNDVNSAAILDNFSPFFAGTIVGTVEAERTYAAATDSRLHNQHYFGSPVNAPSITQFAPAKGADGVAVTPTNDCDETKTAANGNYGNVFEWEEGLVNSCYLQGWKVRSSGVAENAKGYSVVKTGNGTLSLTGTPNLNPFYEVKFLTNGGWLLDSKQGNSFDGGWNLVANPYQAPIDLNDASNADFDDNVLVLRTHGSFPGTFQPVSMAGSGLLAPFQGFLARKSNVGGNATFTINATDRRVATSTFHKSGDHQMSLMVVGNGYADITYLNFNPSSTEQYDSRYDALKAASSTGQPTLFTYILGSWSSINSNPDVITTPTVRVGFKPGKSGTFMFQGEGFADVPNTTVYLEDLRDNVMQNLTAIPDYTFTSNVNDAPDRFLLHFRLESPNAVIDNKAQNATIRMYPNPTSGMLVLETDMKEDVKVEVIDINGKVVIATDMYRNKTIDVSMLASAIYQVRITGSQGSVVKRLVKE